MIGMRSNCPIACSLELLGDPWVLVILRDILLAGKRRYSELARPERIATNVLATRLKKLEAAGVLEVSRDPDDGRSRIYRPTEAALDLIPVLLELAAWGLEHTEHGTAHPELVDQLRADREGLIARLRAAATASSS